VTGTVTITPPLVTDPVGAGIVAGVSAAGAPLASGPISVSLEVPDSALLSLRQQIGRRFQLLTDVAWTGWSSVQELRIVRDTDAIVSVTPEKWQDVFRYALGGAYEVSPTFTLRGGVAHAETPVPESTRTPRLPDSDHTMLAIGVRWQPTESILLDAGYAHVFSDDVSLNQNDGNTAAYGLVNGQQQTAVDVVSTQLVYRF
jgi:long-chain fatty acid transport protein